LNDLWPYLGDDATPRLREYFIGPPFYTGRPFERLEGGGDRAEVANRFTSGDLVAVSMLGVTIQPEAALAILEDPSKTLNGRLADVPKEVDLWAAGEDEVAKGSAAYELWTELDKIVGVGWVIAGKLMARKRPRLIPIYDRSVRQASGARDNWWLSLRKTLQDDESLRNRLMTLRRESGIGEDISLLRVLDVARWMTGGVPPTRR
jgi:hypothetical protein